MGRGRRNRKRGGGDAAAGAPVAATVGASDGGGGGDDDGWAVVGRRGRTLDAAAVEHAASSGAGEDAAAPWATDRPQQLALPAAARGGAGDTWAALRGGSDEARPVLSVAPMMAWTDVHYRSLARMLTRRTLLYTEMIAAPTVLHAAAEGPGALAALLDFPPSQHPIAVQLGGCDPKQMAAAARHCVAAGYDEIGINVGCPSPIVASHRFGAVLMKDPQRTAAIAAAVVGACAGGSGTAATPVSLKHRLGVDDHDSYEELEQFVRTVATSSGITQFVVHARKAWLKELSPTLNLEVPPLRYDWVGRLCQRFPQLRFELNGGLKSLDEVADTRATCSAPRAAPGTDAPDPGSGSAPVQVAGQAPEPVEVAVAECALSGWMIGRAAYKDSWRTLSTADSVLFGHGKDRESKGTIITDPASCRRQVIGGYLTYAEGYWKSKAASSSGGGGGGGGSGSGRQDLLELQDVLCQPLLGLVSESEAAEWRSSLLQGVEALRAVHSSNHGSGGGSGNAGAAAAGAAGFELRRIVEEAMALLPGDLLDAPPQPHHPALTPP